MDTRRLVAVECDHMRPVVKVVDEWYHVDMGGHVTSECSAGKYKVSCTYEGEHTISAAVDG